MAATKSLQVSIAAATTNAAGATTTGAVINLTTAYGALLTGKITNGGTGPTIAAQLNIYTSGDNTNFKLLTSLQAEVTAGLVAEFALEIPAPAMYVRVDCTGNTAQAVTCEALLQVLLTI